MIRLIAIPFIAVLLTGAQCSKAEIDSKIALLTGEPQAPAAFLTIPDEPEVVALVTEPEVIVTPEPPVCTPKLNRGMWTNPCSGEIVGYVE
jgi:hypothetical protein